MGRGRFEPPIAARQIYPPHPMSLPPSDQPDQTPPAGHQARAADRVLWMTVLYNELRALAQSELASERRNHTLSATALVNEAYLKLSQSGQASDPRRPAGAPLDRGVFFGLAAQAMRRILVDHARGKHRRKRGGGQPVAGGESLGFIADPDQDGSPLDAVVLDEALDRLALEHDQAAGVVELRFFAGLTDQEIAGVMQLNERTVRRHWTFAKAWLAREMNPESQDPPREPGPSA